MKTPVAFLIFNRPDTTRRVFAEIARAKPRRLLVVADGPRNSAEAKNCAETRAVLAGVNWDCDVMTNFSDINLGCKSRVATGLDWVFEHCEEAIILEDDCLPDPSFFPFCEELLETYRHDERVAMICGSNFQQGHKISPYSYFFVRHTTVWGWASWRRVWQHYDVKMSMWPILRQANWLESLLVSPVMVEYWRGVFDMMYEGTVERANTWDYQLFFSWWARHALAITPEVNLVTNLGFGSDATHTRDKRALKTMAALPYEPLPMPMRHPPYMYFDRDADQLAFRKICPWIAENQSSYWRLRRKFAEALPEPLRRKIRRLRSKSTTI